VLSGEAIDFIKRSAGTPFLIEVATFAPHAPYTPAPRDAEAFAGLRAPRTPAFDAAPDADAPRWLKAHGPLSEAEIAGIDANFRKRAQSVLAVDAMIGELQAAVAAIGEEKNTYFVFASDNGFHMGEHRLKPGKMTAFDTDIRVPLIVAGPGVPRGRVVSQVVQNVDLYPTFLQLAGARATTPSEGRSLVPLLHPSGGAPQWRSVALVEHQRSDDPADPDFEGGGSNPTTYEAIRISAPHLPGFSGSVEAVYVEYKDPQHETEYYDIRNDPYELRNIAGELTAARRAELHKVVVGLESCHTASACWKAGLAS
jgi:N-acetylglucosamine-6-sulfatase